MNNHKTPLWLYQAAEADRLWHLSQKQRERRHLRNVAILVAIAIGTFLFLVRFLP